MKYASLGNTGLVVSKLAFGSMTFGADDGSGVWKVGQEEANGLVARALDAGVTFFNSADVYAGGQSEEILGKALGKRRDEVAIATKVGNRSGEAIADYGLSRRRVISACDGSLKRLGTDYVDLYLVHLFDAFTPVEETLWALDDLVRQGKVRYVGFSNWPAWRAALALGAQDRHGWARFAAAEMYYSLLGRDVEVEFTDFARQAGVGIMAWSPLSGGFLSGRYTREDPGGGRGRLSSFDFPPIDRERGYDVVDRLKEIGEAQGASPAQVAIAWVMGRPGVSSVLVGASRPEQLESNLGAVDVELSADELASLDELTAPTLPYPSAGWMAGGMVDPMLEEALGDPR